MLLKYANFDQLNTRLEAMKQDSAHGQDFNAISMHTRKCIKKSPNEEAASIAMLLYKLETIDKIPKSQIGFGIELEIMPKII